MIKSTKHNRLPPPPAISKKNRLIIFSHLTGMSLRSYFFILKKKENKGMYGQCLSQNNLLKNRNRLSQEGGRSMLEMLAVLAIMGVLAIGGIAAYSFAVSKHRANQIYNQVDLRAVASFSNPFVRQATPGQTYPLVGYDEVVESITYQHKKTAGNGYDIIASHVPERICRRLQDMTFPVPKSVTLNGADLSSTCGSDNTFVFSYDGLSIGKPSSGVDPIDCNCSGCQSCESGTCQDNDNLCGPKEVCQSGSCVCAPGYTECGGSCYTTCADGFMRDPVTCDCVCEPQACPEHASWDSASCSCVCEDGYEMCNGACHPVCNSSGMTGSRDPDTCACTCIEGTDAATCACPTGYVYINGQCMRLSCKGTSNYYCYINGKLCGYSCNSVGKDCALGICYAEECPDGSTFTQLTTVHSSGYWYGCRKGRWEIMSQSVAYDGVWCCRKDNSFDFDGPCTWGICDETYDCAQYGAIDGYVYHDLYRACIFNQSAPNEYGCTYRSARGAWECYKTDVICGSDCSDPTNCGTCNDVCDYGATYNAETNMCEKDGVSCTLSSPMTCYRGDTRCGASAPADQTSFGQTSSGNCFDPGCSALDMTFGYIESIKYWGCVSTDGMLGCYHEGNMPPINCQYKGKGMCAGYCQTYDASDCDAIFLEECSPIDEETGKPICPYNQTVTKTCVCLSDRNAAVGTLCCPPGQTIVNGGCSTLTCPDGQTPDENGICKTTCANNAEVSDCVCTGSSNKDKFNRTICCEAGYSWNETTEVCE